MPAIRNGASAISITVAMARLALTGNAARKMPSIAKNKPSAARKSDMNPATRHTLFRRAARAWWQRFARRVAEIAEEIRIRPQHQVRVAVLHAAFVSLHRAVESKEPLILAIGLGVDAIALGVALAADLLGLRRGFRQQHGDVAIGPGSDLLGLLAALGAELGRLALPLGLHALIDRLAVLLRQVDAADAHVNDVGAEPLRIAIELIAHQPHQLLTLVAHGVGQRCRSQHAPQRRVEQDRKLRAGAIRPDRLVEFERIGDAVAREGVDDEALTGLGEAGICPGAARGNDFLRRRLDVENALVDIDDAFDEWKFDVEARFGDYASRFAQSHDQSLSGLIDGEEAAIADEKRDEQQDGGGAAREAHSHGVPPGFCAGCCCRVRSPSGRYGTTPGPPCGPVSMIVLSVPPRTCSMVSR